MLGGYYSTDDFALKYAHYTDAKLEFTRKPPPQPTAPANGAELAEGDSVLLQWDPVDEADYYVLVVKPHYLWFYPGNTSHLLTGTEFRLHWDQVPYRNARVEWYVKAVKTFKEDAAVFPELPDYYLAVPPDKTPLLISGFFGEYWGTMPSDYLGALGTEWCESSWIHTAGGTPESFETSRPTGLQPADQGTMGPSGVLSWDAVPGADAYLLWITRDGETAGISFTDTTSLVPSSPGSTELATGMRPADNLLPGETYQWQVCGVRLSAGTYPLTVIEQSGTDPPTIGARYDHPTGLPVLSRWSATHTFTVN